MIKKFDCLQNNIEHAQRKLNVVKIFFELADGIGTNFPFIDNLNKSTCASKQDELVHATNANSPILTYSG